MKNQTYPAFCPICNCPIQLLMADSWGRTKGTIEDALEAHRAVVHPQSTPIEPA